MNTYFTQEDLMRMSRSLLVSTKQATRTLCIGRPWLEEEGDAIIQKCIVRLDSTEREIYFKVSREYGKYLSAERADAYLIGLLSLAMRERCDIQSEVPLTKELVHQLQTELIPALVKYSPKLYAPIILADLEDHPIRSAGKTGTGCSCGIDSLYAIKLLSCETGASISVDYLTLNNVGAYGFGGQTTTTRYRDNESNARAFCEKYGYKLIVTDSNFAEAFPQDHLKTHLFSSCFAIHMLNKLWGRYYYASTGIDLQANFGLTDNELYDSAKYDLIALPAFSTSQLRICNQGASTDRFEKTRELVNFEPATHYLNVCLRQGKGNCGHCSKCLRTLWMLDALGNVDAFKAVFDVEHYKQKRQSYLGLLYQSYLSGGDHHMNDRAWEILKTDASCATHLKAYLGWVAVSFRRLARRVLEKLKSEIKVIIHSH